MTGFVHARDRTSEECLFHWRRVISEAVDDWTKGFALSVARQSRRPGWTPSPAQLGVMRRLVSDLFNHSVGHSEDDEAELIEVTND